MTLSHVCQTIWHLETVIWPIVRLKPFIFSTYDENSSKNFTPTREPMAQSLKKRPQRPVIYTHDWRAYYVGWSRLPHSSILWLDVEIMEREWIALTSKFNFFLVLRWVLTFRRLFIRLIMKVLSTQNTTSRNWSVVGSTHSTMIFDPWPFGHCFFSFNLISQ